MSVISVCELLSGLWIRKTPNSPHIPKSPGPKFFHFCAVFGNFSKFFHFCAIFVDLSPPPIFLLWKTMSSIVHGLDRCLLFGCRPLCGLSSFWWTVAYVVCRLLSGIWGGDPPQTEKSQPPPTKCPKLVRCVSSHLLCWRLFSTVVCFVSTTVAPTVSNCCPLCQLSSDVSTCLLYTSDAADE